MGTALGVTSTVAVSYANRVNPFTGKSMSKPIIDYDFTPDPYGDNVTLYRGTTGSEGKGHTLFMTDDAGYAASYVKTGGSVIKVSISRSTIFNP